MSNDRLTLTQIALLAAYAIGMSGGQILFKFAAVPWRTTSIFWPRWCSMARFRFFGCGS